MLSQKLKILIFEDNKALADLLRKLLQGYGYEVLAFSDPSACPFCQDFQKECPFELPCTDVIISDINMPSMDGIKLFQSQNSRGCKTSNDNKALMSAYPSTRYKNAARELGCHFINKPFKLVDITTWLEECAQRIATDRKLAKL